MVVCLGMILQLWGWDVLHGNEFIWRSQRLSKHMLEAVYCVGHCFHEVCRTHECIWYLIYQWSICSVIANQWECYPKWTRVKRRQDVANQRNLSDKVAKRTLGHALRFFLQNSKCHEVTMFLKSRRIFSNTTLERMAEDSESCFGKTLCKSRSWSRPFYLHFVWWAFQSSVFFSRSGGLEQLHYFGALLLPGEVWSSFRVVFQWTEIFHVWRWWKPQVSISLDCSDHPKQS